MTLIMIATGAALLACAILGWSAARLARSLQPRQAATLVAGGAISLALAAGAGLSATGGALVARLTPIAADGHWSAAAVADRLPVPAWLGLVAALAVATLLLRATVRTALIITALVRSEKACRSIGPAGGPRLVITDDSSADAFTLAGIHGRVVISRQLFDRLTHEERKVVTAHELAHLHHRHHLYVHAADLAAAANPLLRRVPNAVRFSVERWADEEAATSTGSRVDAARALASTALMRTRLLRSHPAGRTVLGRHVPALSATTTMIIQRFDALLAPPPNRRTTRLLCIGLVLMAVFAAGMASLHVVTETIEQASTFMPYHHRI